MELERFLLDDGDIIEFADTRARQNILTVQENLTNRINILENQDGSVADVADIKNNILELSNDISNITNSLNSLNSLIKTKATKEYVNQVVSTLINHAPETLDTLGELAIALQENESIVDALNNAIGSRASQEDLIALDNRTTELEKYQKYLTLNYVASGYGVLEDGKINTNYNTSSKAYNGYKAQQTDYFISTLTFNNAVSAHNNLVERVATLESDEQPENNFIHLTGTAEKPINLYTDLEIGKAYILSGFIKRTTKDNIDLSSWSVLVYKQTANYVMMYNFQITSGGGSSTGSPYFTSISVDSSGKISATPYSFVKLPDKGTGQILTSYYSNTPTWSNLADLPDFTALTSRVTELETITGEVNAALTSILGV